MGGACGTKGAEERCILDFLVKSEGRCYLEDLSVGGRIILKWM